jgi:hypothetical protein
VTAPRPAGVTARGLPYPGSANIHAETPKAIQALAEAIDGQLGSIVGGYQLAFWVGNISIDSAGKSQLLVFPTLSSIRGGLVSYGTFGGGVYRVGTPSGFGSSAKFDMIAAKAQFPAGGGQETFANTTVSACIVAWGIGA